MYNCINDYHKLVICAALPRDPADKIMSLIEQDVHQPVREKQKGVLQELLTHERCVYIRYLHTLLDKIQSTDLLRSGTEGHDDEFIAYIVASLASDIAIYYSLEGELQWKFYKQLLLSKKHKDIYIEVMQLMLGK